MKSVSSSAMKSSCEKVEIAAVACVVIIAMSVDVEGVQLYPDSLQSPTTCDEFSQSARFNPYSVLNDHWFVFYYWGPNMPRVEYVFEYPGTKEKAFLHYILDEFVSIPINWTAKFVVMKNVLNNHTTLLVETGDRGQYLEYPFLILKQKHERINPINVRFKQTSDNKYIGYMNCETDRVLVMARKSHIPRKKYIQEAAARIGYRGRGPRSYLYQGHSWMPIPENDEPNYWRTRDTYKREVEALDKMLDRDSDGNLIYY